MLPLPRRFLLAAGPTLLLPATARATPGAVRSHGLASIGTPALPPDFTHFPYADPAAPKGGQVRLAALGSFDSFNPFIVRGTAATPVIQTFDSLLRDNSNEPGVAYGHLASTIELANDRSWVAFELRPQARFSDDVPVTADDVVWTFTTLLDQGRPFYRAYYADVDKVSADGPGRVIFRFKSSGNRELPLILGEMSILPRHFWQGRDFSRPLPEPPPGSGPYKVDSFALGRTIGLARRANWWAADLPTGRGLSNFDAISTEYFRDATVAMEAFKAGQADFREENIAKNWATGYDFPAVQKGLVIKREIRHHLPTGMQGFAMNLRRPVFADARVRQAMALAFDFEWMNKTLFYGAYTRTRSYFSNSDLASSGLPDAAERALLDPWADRLPAELFTTPFSLPVTDGSGNNRAQLRAALDLLTAAGWAVVQRRLVDKSGQPMRFAILLPDPGYERVALPYVQSLDKLGITAEVRTVDPSQYQHLLDSFDYDMTMNVFSESDVPGNELRDYWSSEAAKSEGSENVIGVADPAVDALVEKIITATDRASLITACRALDRVLLWGWYMVPNWHLSSHRVALWDKFGWPDLPTRAGFVFDAWWIDPARAHALAAASGSGG